MKQDKRTKQQQQQNERDTQGKHTDASLSGCLQTEVENLNL